MTFLTTSPYTSTTRETLGWIWFLAPLLIFVFSWITMWGKESAGDCVPFRPPKETYSIVWIFLVGSLMASWVFVSRSAPTTEWWFLVITYFLVIAMAILWLFMYQQDKLNGIPVFLALLFVLAMSMHVASSVNKFAGALLWPLLIWCVFNLFVNCAEIYCAE